MSVRAPPQSSVFRPSSKELGGTARLLWLPQPHDARSLSYHLNQNDMNDTLINLADLTARQGLTIAATERGRVAFPG
jgi:hypothetical protein